MLAITCLSFNIFCFLYLLFNSSFICSWVKQLSPSCRHSNGMLSSYAHVKFCTGEHELKMKRDDMALNPMKKMYLINWRKKKILFWFTKSYVLFLNILRIPFFWCTIMPWIYTSTLAKVLWLQACYCITRCIILKPSAPLNPLKVYSFDNLFRVKTHNIYK